MTRPASGGCSVMRVHDDDADADAGGRALRCLFNKLSPIRYAHFVRTLLFNAHARARASMGEKIQCVFRTN